MVVHNNIKTRHKSSLEITQLYTYVLGKKNLYHQCYVTTVFHCIAKHNAVNIYNFLIDVNILIKTDERFKYVTRV